MLEEEEKNMKQAEIKYLNEDEALSKYEWFFVHPGKRPASQLL